MVLPRQFIAGLRGKQTWIDGGSLGFFVESIRIRPRLFLLNDQIELIHFEKDDEELAMTRRSNRILYSASETARLVTEGKRCSLKSVVLCGTGPNAVCACQ